MSFRKKKAGRDILGYLLLAVSVLLLGRSLALCLSNDIWYDELFTVGMIEHSYGDLIAFTARDVHPPLYYCIVKFIVELCKLIMPGAGTVIPAKIVSVLPYFMLLLYSFLFIRKRFGAFVCGLFVFCVIAMPQLPAYTVEVRMYGWAMLFVTAAFLHGYGTVTAGTGSSGMGARHVIGKMTMKAHAAALVFYGIAAAYTQYFACVAVVMVYLYVLLVLIRKDRRRIREWFLWVGISVAGYLPWLFVLYRQITAVRESYWILPLTWRSLGGCVKFLMKPAFADDRLNTVLAVVLFGTYISVWGYSALKLYYNRREKQKNFESRRICGAGEEEKADRFWLAAAGIGVLAGLVMFGFAASILVRPIFVYRYMIPALGCFWLSFALGLDELLCKPKRIELEKEENRNGHSRTGKDKIASGMGIALTILVIIIGLRDYRAFMGEEEYKIVNMRETEAALSLICPEDIVIYNFDQVQAVTAYYLPETVERFLWRAEGEKLIQEITSPCGRIEDVDEIRDILETAEAGGKKLWFIGSFNSREEIADEWRKAEFEVKEEGSFLLERYWFNLYRISFSDHNILGTGIKCMPRKELLWRN